MNWMEKLLLRAAQVFWWVTVVTLVAWLIVLLLFQGYWWLTALRGIKC